ncbi:MAG: histidine phosphatase family protein [Rhodobacteraceae bacterium]|nr:histidine phosphatase family protein [Paracoccaceae bacterium]
MIRPAELYWIRHGPTGTGKICGWTDIDCDLSMHDMLRRLDAHLPGDAVVVSSDLKRARRTGDVFSKTRERLADHRDLREINFGDWEGRTPDEIAAQDGTRSRAFWENPFSAHPPGGERWLDLTQRVANAIGALVAAHPGRPLVAVAHFGVIMSHYMHVRRIDREDRFRQIGSPPTIETLSLSRFVCDADGWHVVSLNETFDTEPQSAQANRT